jgi:hypothetical protein
MSAPKSRRNRALTVALVIAALIAAPFVFIAFLATFDRSR